MRHPVPLLDEYRVPLLDDKEAFAVLAFLLREGASTEEEISQATKMSAAVIKSVKRRLFLGRLVRLHGVDKISLTDRSAELLAKLGVTQALIDSHITQDLRASQSIAAWQYVVLKELATSAQVPLRRQLRFRVADFLARTLARDASEACRFLTASAVGMQEYTSYLPWELLHPTNAEDRREVIAFHGAGDLTMNAWNLALSDLNAARATLDKDLLLPDDEQQRRTVRFIILEGCASAMTQIDEPSPFLRFAYHKDQSLPSQLWSLCRRESIDGALRDAVTRFQPEYLIVDLDFSNKSVPDVLQSVLLAHFNKAPAPRMSWLERILLHSTQSPAVFDLALARISELRKMIESSALRDLAEAEQRRLRAELQELVEAFSAQLAQSGTEPEASGGSTPEPLRHNKLQ
ncbi:MAG: hypothetical protein HY820_02230 [Acidobacteria bacterium]|nr:hypothetical protein [Acidobacteriota bacterium]